MTCGRIMRRAVGLGLVLGLGACAPLTPRAPAPSRTPPAASGPSTQPPSTQPEPAPSQPVAPAAPTGPAVVALLGQARRERQAGHLDRSDAALERALHIDPRNPRIWYHMARVRLDEGDPAQAEAFALKCISLSQHELRLQARAWTFVASVRQARGDSQGAAAARAQAAALKR